MADVKKFPQDYREGILPKEFIAELEKQSGQSIEEIVAGIEVLSHEEQQTIIRESYHHQYGVFIRLALFSGLRMEEMLGLQWDDLDTQGTWLRVRYEQIDDGDGFDLRDARFPRSVPLPAHVHSDLMKWRRIQKKAIAAMPPFFWGCTSVTLLLNGYQMDAEILKSIFRDILRRSNLSNMPFSVLRDTFAARALEQGMSTANLCEILGGPMASEIYGCFKDSQEKTNRATDNLSKVEMLRRKMVEE